MTVVDNVIILAAAAKSTASDEAEALPFNFSTSRRTCIFLVRLVASSPEYPLNLITSGILSLPVGLGLPLHVTKRLAAFLARESAPFFLDDMAKFEIKKFVHRALMWYLWAIQCRGTRNNCKKAKLSNLAFEALGNRMHMV